MSLHQSGHRNSPSQTTGTTKSPGKRQCASIWRPPSVSHRTLCAKSNQGTYRSPVEWTMPMPHLDATSKLLHRQFYGTRYRALISARIRISWCTILKHTMPRSEPGLLVMCFNIDPTVNDSICPSFILRRLMHGGHTCRLVCCKLIVGWIRTNVLLAQILGL